MLSHIFAITLVLFAQPNFTGDPLQGVVIQGRITGADNKGMENVRVTLMNDTYSPLQTVYTNGSGRYMFRVAKGYFYIQVEPTEPGYERQQQRIDAMPMYGNTEVYNVDFTLKPVSRGSGLTPGSKPLPIFTQTIPEDAKREFDKGRKSLDKNDVAAGTATLKHAVEIFADYYDALDLLGEIYVKQQQYDSAVPVLKHAVEVNKDGWHSFYSLGVALIELKQYNDGVIALRRAVEINPDSVNANYRLGMILAQSEATREEAIKAMRKVTEMAGKQIPQSYLYLASLYDKNKQYREAADAVEAALKLVPDSEKDKRDQLKRLAEQLRKKVS